MRLPWENYKTGLTARMGNRPSESWSIGDCQKMRLSERTEVLHDLLQIP